MAYSPVEWNTGDVITAAKLNNMDRGITDNNNALEKIGDTNVYNKTVTISGASTRVNILNLDEGIYIICEYITVNKSHQVFSVKNQLYNAEGAIPILYHTGESSNYGTINHTLVLTVGSEGGSISTSILLPASSEEMTAVIDGSITKLK